MKYSYWADGDYYVYRLPANDPDPLLSHDVEVFRYDTLDWAPYNSFGATMLNGEVNPVSEQEAMRVCDVIRKAVAAERASAS